MNRFNLRQACLLFIGILPVTKIFMLPSIVSGISANDGWISTLLNLSLDLVALFFIVYSMQKANCSFSTLLENAVGKTASKIIYGFYAFYFLVKAYTPLVEQKNFVERTLYETAPSFLIFLPFFFVSAYICFKKKVAIGRIADVIGFVSIASLVLLFFLSFGNADFSMALPFGITGAKNITKATFVSLPWYGDAVYLLFLFDGNLGGKKPLIKTLLCYLLAGGFVVLFMLSFYGTFSYISNRQTFALTEISKYSGVISSIGRFDYVAIFGILFSSIFALCLPIYCLVECIAKIFNLKNKLVLSVGVNLLIALLLLLLDPYFNSTLIFVTSVGGWVLFALGNLFPLFLPLFVRRRVNENYKKTNNG